MVSALTVLGLDERGARYADYADLATHVRNAFTDPVATLHELFARITFNIPVGTTGDHAPTARRRRGHAGHGRRRGRPALQPGGGADRRRLWGRQLLNPYALEGWEP